MRSIFPLDLPVAVLVAGLVAGLLAGCAGVGVSTPGVPVQPVAPQTAAPTISTANAQSGASVVSLASTTPNATIFYTRDGSSPNLASPVYQGPFLVSSSLTLKAVATSSSLPVSSVVSKAFSLNIAPGTLLWSDDFPNTGTTNLLPSATNWTYDTGPGSLCCGNSEQEIYCAAGSTAAPCDPGKPNAYIAPGGGLHIVAENPSGSVYTSGRLKSQGHFGFQYGRLEARMLLPESQAMWPAFWLLGDNSGIVSWPACGEIDVMEHLDGSDPAPCLGCKPLGYDWFSGTVHGGASGATEQSAGTTYHRTGYSAAVWHTYGMIWTKGQIQMYVDDPANIYATYKASDAVWSPTPWPFDAGPQFLILNLAIGGSWPGNVDATTVFPSTMQVQYVRIYAP